MINFGHDGKLYIAIGDGGNANDVGSGHSFPQGNGQDPHNVLGTILRIDTDGAVRLAAVAGIQVAVVALLRRLEHPVPTLGKHHAGVVRGGVGRRVGVGCRVGVGARGGRTAL